MSEATVDSMDAPSTELEQLLEHVTMRLRSLVDQLPEQATVIGSGDVDAIRALVERRAVVINSMGDASGRIPDLLAAGTPSERANLAIREAEHLLERLLEADRDATRSIELQCSGIKEELNLNRRAGNAAQVYQGASAVPPPARFSDREV